MNVQVIVGAQEIQTALQTLKAASEPGRSNDGVRVMVHYKAFRTPTPKALAEAALARDEGWALDTYSGTLDRVFTSRTGDLCFTIRALERVGGDGRHCFRTFNTVRGQVLELVVMGNGNGKNPDSTMHPPADPMPPQ